MLDPMVIVCEPIVVQVVPFDERELVNTFPLRVTFSQYGATNPVVFTWTLAPPVVVRYWNVTPLAGVMKVEACLALELRLSRIITPAFAQGSVVPTFVTWATRLQSPFAV